MKKGLTLFFSAVLASCSFLLASKSVVLAAYEPIGEVTCAANQGKLNIHFQRWGGDINDVNAHYWTNGEDGKTIKVAKRDNFGAVFQVCINSNEPDKVGFIARKNAGEDGLHADWDHGKLTDDVMIDVTSIKGSGEMHVYTFEKSTNVIYADSNKYNMVVVYFDGSGVYEEDLGMHAFGTWTTTAEGWGKPLKAFDKTAKAPDKARDIKIAHLTSTGIRNEDPDKTGTLIYAGDDSSKKHASYGDIFYPQDAQKGELVLYYVTGGEVYTDVNEFCENAFVFKLIDKYVDSKGYLAGTYAVNPTTIFVKTTAEIVVPKKNSEDADLTVEERKAIAIDYFTLTEKGSTTKIAIESIDFNLMASSTTEFVITLKDSNKLTNTKEYNLAFDLGKTDDTNYAYELQLDLDTEAPTVTLLGSTVVELKKGQAWKSELFPLYSADDDRDGDLTNFVFVPEGKGILNLGKKGEYKITLAVSDAWGNTNEVEFTFKVK